jgi:transposase-like protein
VEKEEPNPIGRPTKYDPRFCEEAILFIGEQGKSITQFARHIRVAKSSVYLWADKNKAFSDALELSRDWSEAYWEDELEDMMRDRSVNAPLVKLYLSNRFGWRDQVNDQDAEAPPIDPVFEVVEAQREVRTTNAKP